MPAEISLAVTAVLLAGGVVYSLWKTRGEAPQPSLSAKTAATYEGLRVREIMTPSFASVGPEATIGEVAALMAAGGAGGVLVLDEARRPMGIITEGDLIRREALGREPQTSLWRTLFTDDKNLARAFAKAYGKKVREVMSRHLKTVTEDTSVSQAAALLYMAGVKQLPVMRGGEVVGIVSRSDIVRALSRLGEQLGSERASDGTIADALRARIARAGWVSPQQIGFSVQRGRVEFSGVVTSEDQRLALHALAEGVTGVREVVDRLDLTTRLAARQA
jgi:CBS domain-containing protein